MCNGTSHTTTSWGFYPGLNIYFICERCPWSHRIFWYTTTPCMWNPVLQMRSTLETYYTLNHSVFLILFSCLFTKALNSIFFSTLGSLHFHTLSSQLKGIWHFAQPFIIAIVNYCYQAPYTRFNALVVLNQNKYLQTTRDISAVFWLYIIISYLCVSKITNHNYTKHEFNINLTFVISHKILITKTFDNFKMLHLVFIFIFNGMYVALIIFCLLNPLWIILFPSGQEVVQLHVYAQTWC